MIKQAILTIVSVAFVGCSVLVSAPPPRFPQFNEHPITGRGTYELPQWSPDSRYLAFIDAPGDYSALAVYDTETGRRWNVAKGVDASHFSWGPDEHLTYLNYRSDLSGSPFPSILELHQVDLDGKNDRVIAEELHNADDFAWFSNGEEMVILLTEPDARSFCQDVYLLDATKGESRLLLRSRDLGYDCITMVALSPDETLLLVYGIHKGGKPNTWITIYNLEDQAVVQKIDPSEIVSSGDVTYPTPGIGDDTNLGWVDGQRWIFAKVNTPGGECYNYALFFFVMDDLANSFCIPSVEGPFAGPVISPDLTKISYVTVVGPANYYVMIGNVTPDLLTHLKTGGEE